MYGYQAYNGIGEAIGVPVSTHEEAFRILGNACRGSYLIKKAKIVKLLFLAGHSSKRVAVWNYGGDRPEGF